MSASTILTRTKRTHYVISPKNTGTSGGCRAIIRWCRQLCRRAFASGQKQCGLAMRFSI